MVTVFVKMTIPAMKTQQHVQKIVDSVGTELAVIRRTPQPVPMIVAFVGIMFVQLVKQMHPAPTTARFVVTDSVTRSVVRT